MIHRALFGSIERFFAILVEHYAGAFPAWLAPVQVTILPVADRHHAYAFRIADRLRAEGHRVDLVGADDGKLGARVGRAKREKVPYVLVVGDDDVETGTVGRQPARDRRPRAGRRRRPLRRAPRGRRARAAVVPEAAGLERLWAGWRDAYVSGVAQADHDEPAGDECIFCALADDDPGNEQVLARGEHVFALLNAYPYNSGHLMVAPRRHEGNLEALTGDEAAELMGMIVDCDAGPQGRVPARRRQRRDEPGPGRRGRDPGPPPRARAPALVRRHQLHDHRRRGPGAPRGAARTYERLRSAWPT